MNYNKDQIEEIILSNGYKREMSQIIIKLLDYMNKKQWYGACHACSSVLYVLLSEIGYKPNLYVGEVKEKNYLFDHSWIEIDNKVIDLAISMTLENGIAVSAPVILDINSETKEKTTIEYGIRGQGLDDETLFLLNLTFNDYMKFFPDNDRGLWGIIEEILGRQINIEEFERKYYTTQRQIKRQKGG